jgi:hypothetical protein
MTDSWLDGLDAARAIGRRISEIRRLEKVRERLSHKVISDSLNFSFQFKKTRNDLSKPPLEGRDARQPIS